MSSTSFIAASLDDSIFQGQPAATADAAARKEVVFIDGGVTGYEAMLADLPAGVEIVILDGSGDGLAQMADWAASHSGYDAIHLISHGAEGALQLGGLILDSATATARAGDLAALGNALSETGDLLLYGCDVAGGEGEAFLRQLSALTGADIAASTDITGAASLGGDWALEASTGAVETVSLDLQNFDGTLAVEGNTATLKVYLSDDSLNYTSPSKSISSGDEEFEADVVGGSVYMDINNNEIIFTSNDGDAEMPAYYLIDFGSAHGLNIDSGGVKDDNEYFTLTQVDSDTLRIDVNVTKMPAGTATISLASSNAAPVLTAPTGITFTDTAAADSFTNQTGTLSATDADNDTLTYGISSGTTGGSTTINSITYDVSKAGTYGTLYVKSTTGAYVYVPNDTAINAASSTQTDSFTMSVTDGKVSSPVTKTLTVTINGVNDAPTMGGTGTTTAATEQVPVIIAPTVTISDVDGDADWNGGTLKVGITANSYSYDTLTLPTSDPGGNGIWLDGTDLKAGATVIGSASAASVSGAVVWTFTFNANATNALVQSVAQAVRYTADGDAPHPDGPADDRTITFTATDKGGLSNAVTQAVSVTGVDDPPSLTPGSSFTTITVIEDAAGDIFGAFANITIKDDDNVAIGRDIDIFITATAGTFIAVDGDGVEVGNGQSGQPVTTLMLSGSVADINAYLKNFGNITYQGGANVSGTAAATLTVTARDSDNNAPVSLGSITVNITGQPDVTSVTRPANGTYGVGANLDFTVNFDQAVTVDTNGGTPRIALNVGGTTRYAEYLSGTGDTVLTFRYVVQANDNDDDGIALSGTTIDLNGGNLFGTSGGVDANPALGTVGSLANVKVDTLAPTITDVTIPDSGPYKIGDSITVTITAQDNETGLTLDSGTVNGVALTGFQDKGGGVYTATYTVQEGDTDRAAGDNIPVNITLKDAAGNISTAFTTAIIGANDAIDANAPAVPTLSIDDTGVSNSDGITSDKTVTVSGLEVGATWEYRLDDKGSWIAGTGTTVTLAEGTYANSTALAVRQIDAAGNLGDIEYLTVTVDTTKPIVMTGPGTPTTALTNADTLTYQVSFDEDVFNIDAADFELIGTGGSVGTPTLTVTAQDARNYTVEVSGGNLAGYNGNVSLQLSQSRDLTDAAGNVPDVDAGSYFEYTLDNDAPTAPTLSLANDTGTSASDFITGNGTVNVTGLESGASWEYSTNGGTNWTSGTGTSFTLTGDGAKTVIVRQTDEAGNTSANSTALAFTLDTTATVTNVLVPDPGTYKAGQALSFTVNLDEDVTVTGTPRLALTIGSSTVYATYDSTNSTATALKFTYTVQAGDLDANGIEIGTLQLNGGTIRDVAGNNLTLTLNNLGSTTGVLVDAVAPTLTGSTPADDAAYVLLDSNIVLTFSENIKVNAGNSGENLTLYEWDGTTWAEFQSWTLSESPAGVTISGNTLTIDPTKDLNKATQYAVKLATDAVTDLAGNGFNGFDDYTTLNFTSIDPSSLVTTAASFNTINGTNILNNLSVSPDNETIVIAAPSHLQDSTLNGGDGIDTVRLAAGNGSSFDFTSAKNVTAAETLVVDSAHGSAVTVTVSSAKGLDSFSTLTGTNDDVLVLSGGGTSEEFDLTAKTLSGFNTVQMSGAAATGYTLKLKAIQVTDKAVASNVASITGSAGTNDTLILVDSGSINLTSTGLALSGIETVSFNNDNASRTVTIDQALNLAFGTSGTNEVSTALAALDLSGKTLTGVDALTSNNGTGTAFKLAYAQLGGTGVTSITGGSGSGDVLEVVGSASLVNITALAVSGIETLTNLTSTGGFILNNKALTDVTTINGNQSIISTTSDLDISKLTLSGVERLSTTVTSGAITFTVDGSQLGTGKITQITGKAAIDLTVTTASASLDLTGVTTLSNVDALVSTNATGTSFTLSSSQIGSGKVVSITGGSGTDDVLRVDGGNVDLSGLTEITGVETFENQNETANITVGQAAFDGIKAFTTGKNGTLSFTSAVTDIDLTAKTLTGVGTVLTQASSGDVKITINGDQLQGSGGVIQYIGAPDSANVSLYVTGSSFNASAVTLANIDLITTSSTTGVNFTGSGSSDYIRGGIGNDTIFGNIGGTDTLEGGGGDDVFVISGPDFSLFGTTRILDADTGDIIRINGSTFTTGAITVGNGTGLTANQIHLEDIGGGVTRLHVGIDGNAGADLTIDLVGTYTVDNFKTSGTDITVALNATPTITAPASKVLDENASKVSLGMITIADSDGDDQEVTLSANSGTFSLTTTGLTVTSGTASNSDSITFTGSLSAINTALATLTFTAVPNETGTQADRLAITSSDGKGGFQSHDIWIDLTDIKPQLAPQTFTVAENSAAGTVVGTVVATADTNGLTWSISGGTGSKLFQIDPTTGEIKVAAGANLDYETQTSYTLTVDVDDEDFDSIADASTTITINLTDIDENPPVSPPPPPPPPPPVVGPPVVIPPPVTPPTLPPAPPSTTPVAPPPAPVVPVTGTTTEDGVPVGRGTGTDSLTGRQTEQIIVAPVTSDRQDVGGTPTSNADIRLGGTVEAPTLIATLPTGVGIQASGATNLTLGELASAAGQEAGRINASGNVQTGTVSLAGLSTVLPSSTPVTLRTVTPTLADGVTTPSSEPIIISVPTSTDTSGTVSAVIIDGRSLPSGTVIELRNVDYAVVTGNVFVTGGTGQNVVIGDDARQYIRLGPDDDTLRGGGGDDTVGSGEGRDLIYGDEGNDSIFGGEGYDRLDGGTGNDTIDGGTGTDVARIHANFADLTITRLADGSVRITDTKGDQGTDILTSIEVLRLDDRVILLDTVNVIEAGYKVSNFSEKQYLEMHPDVAAAVKAGLLASGLDHYQKYGEAEGRVTSPMFDSAYYLAHNPDVAAAVARGEFASAFTHFLAWGEAEKRQPDISHAYDGSLFSETYYVEVHRDVALAIVNGQFTSGYEHWVKWGQTEGRSTFGPVNFDLSLFDEAFYVTQNPDVAAAITAGIFVSGLDHFTRYGEREGRDASALFDSEWYLEKNPDVAAAVANGILSSALEHYALYGWKEERNPSAWFDTKKYLADHSDVAASGLNPLAHLLEYGQGEGRLITAADTGMWL